MPIYVDPMFKTPTSSRWPYKAACHLFGTPIDELHRVAIASGLRREWFQEKGSLPHYDLTATRRHLAIKHGAIPVKGHELKAALEATRATAEGR
jgi:hypothetical protein